MIKTTNLEERTMEKKSVTTIVVDSTTNLVMDIRTGEGTVHLTPFIKEENEFGMPTWDYD